MTSFSEFWNGLNWSALLDILLRIIPAFICIVLHEISHGAVAYALGDDTAKRAGRLTLNPIKHIDIMGLVMMVLFRFGWAKPVPVNMQNFKNPKRGMAITALAGPVSNVIIAAVFLFLLGILCVPFFPGIQFLPVAMVNTNGQYIMRYFLPDGAFAKAVMETVMHTVYLSTALAIFNIIPISPLDGSKVLFSFLSDEAYFKLMRYERYGMIILIVLVYTGATSGFLSTVTGWVLNKLFFISEFGFKLASGVA